MIVSIDNINYIIDREEDYKYTLEFYDNLLNKKIIIESKFYNILNFLIDKIKNYVYKEIGRKENNIIINNDYLINIGNNNITIFDTKRGFTIKQENINNLDLMINYLCDIIRDELDEKMLEYIQEKFTVI